MVKSTVWVYLERSGDGFEEVSLEILGTARDMSERYGHRVTGIVMGSELSDLGGIAAGFGAEEVLFVRDDGLREYGTERYTKALADAILEKKPDSLLVGATLNGRDLAARVAARIRTGLAANVVTLDMDESGKLYSGVPGYGSKIIAQILCVNNKPQMSTVRPGIFSKRKFSPADSAKVIEFAPDLKGIENNVSVISRLTRESREISGSNKVIVAGNGVSSNISLVGKLSDVIQADVGATRPMADRGLYPREVQVGSTGISLKADKVLVLGSSGSEHFVSGVANCGTVISVDIDPKSDMFEYSDYCVVGDASKILAEIIAMKEVASQ